MVRELPGFQVCQKCLAFGKFSIAIPDEKCEIPGVKDDNIHPFNRSQTRWR